MLWNIYSGGITFIETQLYVSCNKQGLGQGSFLIPKGPFVPMGDKLVLGSDAWFHTIFGFFEFLSKYVSGYSSHEHKFHDFRSYGSKVYGCLKFLG
jgi:hypothetical protein